MVASGLEICSFCLPLFQTFLLNSVQDGEHVVEQAGWHEAIYS